MGIKKKVIATVAAVATLGSLGIAASTAEAGTGWSALSDQEKNSSYGFFVWKSENAATQAEKRCRSKSRQHSENREVCQLHQDWRGR